MDYEQLGLLAIKREDHQEALNIFKRLLEVKKGAAGYSGYGVASFNLGDYPAARWAFHKALEFEPGNASALAYIEKIENHKKKPSAARRGAPFRAGQDYLEVHGKGGWKKFFIKGINLGLGLPGSFPGEFAIKKQTYLKWFAQIHELGVNSIRTYTLYPPSFYEALHEFNSPSERLFLFQGIWVELPEDNDFNGGEFQARVTGDIKGVINAVYGNENLPERPGYASGIYDHDVSRYVAGFVFGREWESCAVKGFNGLTGSAVEDYRGAFLGIDGGSPAEVWVTRQCDLIQRYEHEGYGNTRPVSAVNWLTLDPLAHPSESGYEEEQAFLGVKVNQSVCNENEDSEAIDFKKIKSLDGAGFFSTYHAYPYYPDFMNNDYLGEQDPYRAYLAELKAHHAGQPVVIAEFGVPSSRETAHWHRGGRHHGGHSETRQGEINGLLMKSIYETGMAGGMLFSWSDEWFKRNWLFSPYELPPERNPLWFNLQDAEQNYGLLATYPNYPGKKVSLGAVESEWDGAHALYRKGGDEQAFRFNDGHDASRALTGLSAQHDEGFFYIRLRTKGEMDFSRAAFLIGIDTCGPGSGEFLMPYGTDAASPVGLKFLVCLSGTRGSRVLACHTYDKYLNMNTGVIRPAHSDQGAWVVMQNRVNVRRLSKDLKSFFPSRVFPMSNLRFGSLDARSPHYDSLADFFFTGNTVEVRLPWGLINFTDPSSRTVLWKEGKQKTRKTDGIRLVAVSYRPEKGLVAAKTGEKDNITDSLPFGLAPEDVRRYSWEEWDTPVYHSYLKQGYYEYKEALSRIPEAP